MIMKPVPRLMSFATLASVLIVSLQAAAPASAQQFEKTVQNCEIDYIFQILRKEKHKAVATTGGRPLGVHPTGCGFGAGYKTRKAAINAALAACQKSEGPAYPGKCKIIEVQ